MAVNKELLKKTMNQILLHPEQWNQEKWHCGTSHCFAGWGQILAGFPEDGMEIMEQMRSEFGISKVQAVYLFDSDRSLVELYCYVKAILDGTMGENGTLAGDLDKLLL